MSYHTQIKKILTQRNREDVDPRHVEACMRLEHSTLSNLSPHVFHKEVCLGITFVNLVGVDAAEATATSFGL